MSDIQDSDRYTIKIKFLKCNVDPFFVLKVIVC
jgi:hypothetical protein